MRKENRITRIPNLDSVVESPLLPACALALPPPGVLKQGTCWLTGFPKDQGISDSKKSQWIINAMGMSAFGGMSATPRCLPVPQRLEGMKKLV